MSLDLVVPMLLTSLVMPLISGGGTRRHVLRITDVDRPSYGNYKPGATTNVIVSRTRRSSAKASTRSIMPLSSPAKTSVAKLAE